MTGQHLVIVRGRLDDVELAALTAVLTALGRQAAVARQPEAGPPLSSWVWQAEFVFGNSWMRQQAAWASSRLPVHRENKLPQWENWAAG